jgi:hypothetical protein
MILYLEVALDENLFPKTFKFKITNNSYSPVKEYVKGKHHKILSQNQNLIFVDFNDKEDHSNAYKIKQRSKLFLKLLEQK